MKLANLVLDALAVIILVAFVAGILTFVFMPIVNPT